jgi:hypothetical protein
MRVSCVGCRIHRDSSDARCANCGSFGVTPIDCALTCCDPYAQLDRIAGMTVISVAALDVLEALALKVARTDLTIDDARRLAGRGLDALRTERAVGRCKPPKGVAASHASDATHS